MKRVAVICSAVLAAIAVAPVFVQAEHTKFAGTDSCKICHDPAGEESQFKQWSQTGHAQALETLKTDAALEVAKREGLDAAPHEAAECLRCHVTGYDVEAKKTAAKISMRMGVQCETCHGPAADHVSEAKKFKIMKKDPAELSPMSAQPKEELCVTCHNKDNPTWDDTRYTLADGTTTGFDFEQAYEKIKH